MDDERVVGHGNGPTEGLAAPDLADATRSAIERPIDFPPMASAIVPGDHVAIPVDPAMPGLATVLDVLVEAARSAGAEDVTVVATGPGPQVGPTEGVNWVVHDPDDRNGIAYLASTKEGHRVYLNRILTDADIVVALGPMGYDPALGYSGPWSTLYPGLSDRDTQARFRSLAVDDPPDRDRPRPGFAESVEVSWLLGSQFQVGVVAGTAGPIAVVAGLDASVRERGPEAVDAAWSRPFPDRADLVVVGIGTPDRPSTIDDLTLGLAAASRSVRRGGKIVALARVDDEPGVAIRRMAAADDSRAATASLRGLEKEPDYLAARRIASAVAWADVYLHSNLDADLVDDLGLIAVDRREDARKLADRSPSSIFIGQAERARVVIQDEPA
ncbi:lactate racemase domain-containing protein [Tundrisphaera sp. TA3]|uniref:lactate racemase domain-containing protein n=1 Tax=Tundrisphaera sp. TA3 TaxID=3435775 RepID=UPI003EB96E76